MTTPRQFAEHIHSVEDLRSRVEALQSEMMQITAPRENLFGLVLNWPIFTLACIGALASGAFAVLAIYPLAKASSQYWLG